MYPLSIVFLRMETRTNEIDFKGAERFDRVSIVILTCKTKMLQFVIKLIILIAKILGHRFCDYFVTKIGEL